MCTNKRIKDENIIMKTKDYKFMIEINIENRYLPSPIKVMVGANSTTYLDKFIDNKILNISKQYNYNGFIDMNIKYIKPKKRIVYKTVYVDGDRLTKQPKFYT
jgi:hypothetical protein